MVASSMALKTGLRGFARTTKLFASTATKVSTTGVEVVSPMIGLTDEQKEFYKLARNFADNEFKPHAGGTIALILHMLA